MGRPLNKKYFGNRNIGSASVTTDNGIGGSAAGTVAIVGANNSSGFTAGSTQVTLSAPTIPGGVTATASLVVGPAGAFLTTAASTSGTNRTTFTATGTGTTATGTYTGLVQKAGGTTTGSGATFTIVKATAGTNYATGGVLTTITATSKGTGYVVGDTIVIDGALIGGVTTTNDITLTVVGAVAAAGTITAINIVEPGSGYVSVPTFTFTVGTIGTAAPAVTFAADTGSAGSATNEENAIIVTAFIPAANGGTAAATGDIVKQTNDKRYKVKTSEGTGICQLKTSAAASAAGEMSIKATDSEGKNYLVAKLTSRKVVLVPAALGGDAGTQFASGTSAKWTFGDAVLNTTVKIENA
jgi:hypothetical protein